MKKRYISPILTFEIIEDAFDILVNTSHDKLRDYNGGSIAGTISTDPIIISNDELTPDPSDPKPGDPDWDKDE